MAWIDCNSDGLRQIVHLSNGVTVIGRSRRARVQVRTDPRVSGVHCSIRAAEDGFHLLDEQSRNGTFLNGQGVHGDKPLLHEGDQIRIGDTVLVFCAEKPPDFADPQAEMTQVSEGFVARILGWLGERFGG